MVNTALVLLGFWTGYSEMSPEKLRGTNPDQYLCLALLIVMPLGVILTVCFPRRESLRRPSWDRCPLFFGRDPLQGCFVTTVVTFACAVAASIRTPGSGTIGHWTVAVWWSIFIGLILGQTIACAVLRDRLTRAA